MAVEKAPAAAHDLKQLPLDVARGWFAALQGGNAGAAAAYGVFPFTFWINKPSPCRLVAQDSSSLKVLIGCILTSESILTQELREAESFPLALNDLKHLESSVKKVLGETAPNATFVSTYINGDGITYEIVIVLASGAEGQLGVRAMLVDYEVEGG